MRRIIAAVLLIVAGGLIYILFRSQQIILNEIIGDGWPWLEQWRAAAAVWLRQSGALGEFVVYSLPGGLWASSYILFVDDAHRSASARVRIVWASVVPLAGAVVELLQACCPAGYMVGGISIGTFSVLDLVCYLTPLAIYILLLKLHYPS